MKVVFIGGGASNLLGSILLKKRNPSYDVFLVEKEKKLGKKLSATGGGKCNIAPKEDDVSVYNESSRSFLEELYKDISFDDYLSLLKELGIATKKIKEYGYYPINESAPQVVKNLYHQINVLDIKIIYDEFIDYHLDRNKVHILLKNQELDADKVFFALGGLNKDNSQIFINHNIKINALYPGLCPIKVKEDVSSLFGNRFEANISLIYKDRCIKTLYSEIQFKKDAISGIASMNLASEISRRLSNTNISDYKINISLTDEQLKDISIYKDKTIEEVFYIYLKEEYANYLLNKYNLSRKDKFNDKALEILRNNTFNVSSLYSEKDAQITVGGVSIDNIDSDFSIKNTNKKIYILGEMLDVDGYCGGYNLRFAITSAFKAIQTIIK